VRKKALLPAANERENMRSLHKPAWPGISLMRAHSRNSRLVFALLLLAGCSFALAQQPAATPAKPAQTGRRVPEAKTRQEFNDYNSAYALSGGAQVEKAADEFSTKYPASELKSYLYAKALHDYQSENNPAKMLAMGERVLQLDPDNTIALVLTATVLADGLGEHDSDRQVKVDRIRKDTAHALETIDSAFTPPANATPEQVTAYKKTLQSMAHSALGIAALKTGEDAAAEQELRSAAELNAAQPDPYIWYHLALAQDHQQKYPEALVSINKAVEYAGNSDLADMARNERKRLMMKNGVMGTEDAKPAPGSAAEKPQPPAAKPPAPK
jgi:tetratricopeptide (TPR) repeat protein